MIVKTVSAHHNPAAMRQRTVGRLCQTLIDWNPAFHRNALQRSHQARAFTLIELLVVIAIIAILIGLLFPAFRAVQDQAKRTQAKNDLTQIVNAVNAYYTDYGKYPLVTADTTVWSGRYRKRCAFQRAARSKAQLSNPRQIVFIISALCEGSGQSAIWNRYASDSDQWDCSSDWRLCRSLGNALQYQN